MMVPIVLGGELIMWATLKFCVVKVKNEIQPKIPSSAD